MQHTRDAAAVGRHPPCACALAHWGEAGIKAPEPAAGGELGKGVDDGGADALVGRGLGVAASEAESGGGSDLVAERGVPVVVVVSEMWTWASGGWVGRVVVGCVTLVGEGKGVGPSGRGL